MGVKDKTAQRDSSIDHLSTYDGNGKKKIIISESKEYILKF
jgi:hypothetical protein